MWYLQTVSADKVKNTGLKTSRHRVMKMAQRKTELAVKGHISALKFSSLCSLSSIHQVSWKSFFHLSVSNIFADVESSFTRSEFVLINLEVRAPFPEIDSLSTAGDSAWSLPKNFPSLLAADRQVCIGYRCSFKGQERMPSSENPM